MERLTESGVNIGFLDNRKLPSYESIYEKLREYEDLEEQGLLLRLPCKVGTPVYVIIKGYCGIHPSCVDDCECCNEAVPQVAEAHFDLELLDGFGKTVFLTKEEAEQALKEGGKNE